MKFACCFVLLLLLVSCEKVVHLETSGQQPLLVVDGSIESGQPPSITLTKSFSYFDSITNAQLLQSYVHNASVIINDGSRDYHLKEYSQRISASQTVYFYAPAANAYFTGAVNKKYSLRILVDSVLYTSETSIPVLAKTCDSLWWEKAPNTADTSRKVVLFGRFTDPKGYGNYVRYFTRVNEEPFYAGLPSVYDDQLTDGTTYNLQIDRGYNHNAALNLFNDSYGVFYRGDTITFKFCNIDKASFDFWRTWDYDYQTNGNPFASPIKVIGNISNGALGAFCGYSVQYKSLIIPK